jgi:hypothetical protein
MNRRDVLATVGSVGVVATAGCTSVGATTITDPDEERTDDGAVNLTFQMESGQSVATLTVMPGRQRYLGHDGEQVPVKIAITHPEATTIGSVRLELRAPPSGAGVPAAVAFTTPFAKPHPSMELFTAPDDVSTVLAIPETGAQGDGTMLFDFLLTNLADGTAELAVDAKLQVTERGLLGEPYRLEGRTRVALPDQTA